MSNQPVYPGMTRWVKVAGILAVAIALLLVGIMISGIAGPHGPGRHLSFTEAASPVPPEDRSP